MDQQYDGTSELVAQIERYAKESRIDELEKEIWSLKVQRTEVTSVKPGKMTYKKLSNLFFRQDPKEVAKAVEKSLDLAEYERDGLVTELNRQDQRAMAMEMEGNIDGGEDFGFDEDFVEGDELDDDDL